jgi:hypothetical protein
MNDKATDTNPGPEIFELTTAGVETLPVSIYDKLMQARKAFHEIDIKKSGHNEFSNYKYFELGDFLLPAMRCMGDHGLVPVVSFSHEYATMTVNDIETGESFCITSPMSTAKLKACHEVQNLGAVESYERRYLWMTLMEVVESDQAEKVKPAAELATPDQIAAMFDFKDTPYMTSGQSAWLDHASDKITYDQADYVLEKLREKEDAGEEVE